MKSKKVTLSSGQKLMLGLSIGFLSMMLVLFFWLKMVV